MEVVGSNPTAPTIPTYQSNHVERTLLSAAFDFAFDFASDFAFAFDAAFGFAFNVAFDAFSQLSR